MTKLTWQTESRDEIEQSGMDLWRNSLYLMCSWVPVTSWISILHEKSLGEIKSNLLPQTTANTMAVERRRFDGVISPNRPLGRAIGDAVVDISLTIVHWCWSCLQEYLIFYWSIWFFPDSRYHFTRGFCYNFSPSRQSIKKSHYIVS